MSLETELSEYRNQIEPVQNLNQKNTKIKFNGSENWIEWIRIGETD